MTDNPHKIELRRGGYFVKYNQSWGGPWRTYEAAELAAQHRYREAIDAECASKDTPHAD